jgi:hypothetical protein
MFLDETGENHEEGRSLSSIKYILIVRFQVLTAASMKMAVLYILLANAPTEVHIDHQHIDDV